MSTDIENVLKKGKEGIKENLLNAFDEFADAYADETWQIINELIKLRAENAELRAKLKESGGLTTYKIIYDGVLGKFFISKYTEKYEFIGNFDNEQEAKRKLVELKGEKE